MKLDFSSGKVTLVICPFDLRAGFYKLSATARDYLNIDVAKGRDFVVFVSRKRHCAKIIYQDKKGSVLITRHLTQGSFQQLTGALTGPAAKTLTVKELALYLDGEVLEVKRKKLYGG